MVRDRLHRIKKKDHRRPLTVRALAVFMALAMVLSVIYVNNRGSKVEAEASYHEMDDFATDLLGASYATGDYSVQSAYKGVRVLLNETEVVKTETDCTVSAYDRLYKRDSEPAGGYTEDDPEYMIADAQPAEYSPYTVTFDSKYTVKWYVGDSEAETASYDGATCDIVKAAESDVTAKLKKVVTISNVKGAGGEALPAGIESQIASEVSANEEDEISSVVVKTIKLDDISATVTDKTIEFTDPDITKYSTSICDITLGQILYVVTKDGGEATKYYGPQGYQDLCNILNSPSSKDDGAYTIKKVVQPITGQDKTSAFTSEVDVSRDFYFLESVSASSEGAGTFSDTAAPFDITVPASGKADPSKDLVLNFITDVEYSSAVIKKDGLDISSSVSKSGTSASTTGATFTIPADTTNNNGKTVAYTVDLTSGTGADTITDSFSVTVDYASGTPTVKQEKIGSDDLDSLPAIGTRPKAKYVSTDSASLNAVVVMDSTYVTVDSVALYNTDASGNITGDAIETKDSTGIGSDGSVSFDATLNPGMNYFKMKATSSYGISAQSRMFTVFYDDADVILDTVEIENAVDSTYTNHYSKADIKDKTVTIDNGKVTSQKNLRVWIEYSDYQEGDTDPNSGSQVAANGVSKFTFAGKEYDISASGVASLVTIPVDDIKDTYKTGGDATGTFTLTDNAGGTSDCSVTLSFYNEEATIDAEYVPTVTDTKYFIWDDPSAPAAEIKYTVTSEVEITSATFRGTTVSVPLPTTDANNNYVYTFECPFSSSDLSSSKEINDIEFTVTNKNGYPTTKTIDVVGIDVTKPDNTTDMDGDTSWHNTPLVITVTVNDGTYSSDIDSVVVTGTDNSNPTISGGKFTATVNESTSSSGTQVTISSKDRAGNVSNLYDPKFCVDLHAPKLTLTVGGQDWSVVKSPNNVLSEDPVIHYEWSDTVSGISTQKITIDGVDYYDDSVNDKKLSEIVGPLDPTHDYTISITATDNAGNVAGPNSCTFRVDGDKPVVTGSIDTVAKKASRPTYFNQDVSVSVNVTDANIKIEKVTAVDSNGHSIEFTKSKPSTGVTGTISASSEGDYEITVTAEDEGGLVGTWTVSFTIDKTDPAVVTQLNGAEYTASNSYHDADVTTGIVVTDDTEDLSDITTTIYRDIPGDGSETQVKSGKGPFTISEDGHYIVTYKVVDKAGNETTKTIGFTVDKTAPVHNLYVTTDNPAKYSSYQNNYINMVGLFTKHKSQENYAYGQYYNSDVTIELGYFDYNMDWVYVTDNGAEIKPTWSESKGYGTATITISQEGYHEIKMWSCDLAGNEVNDNAVGKKITFTIDKTQPYLTIFVNGSQYTEGSGVRYLNTNANVTVSSSDTNNDSSDIKRYYKMTPPGGSSTSTEAVIGDGTENFSTEADYELQYTVTDKAGNVSATRNVFFRVDKTAPQLSISDVGATSTAGSVTLSFTVKEAFYWDMNPVKISIYKKKDGQGETLEKTIDFTPRSANDSTSYTFTDDAEYRMEMTAEDKCGNKTETKYSFIKDGTAPTILLSGVSNYDKTDQDVSLKVSVNEAFYSTNKVTLKGTRTDIDGKKNDIQFDNFVTNRSQLSELEQLFNEDGVYDITVTSTDKAGNTSSKSVHFTIDTTDPEIGDLSKYDGVKTNKFEWDVNLDELVRDLTVCEISLYLDGALYDGTSEIADGSHVLRVEAVDELGHKSSKEVTFVLDSKGPNIIVSNVEEGDRLLEATEISVTVELDEDVLDTVQLNGKTIEVNDNKATLTVDQKGTYKIAAAAHDEAGNNTTAEVNFTFGKQTNFMIIGVIAGIAILLLLLLLFLLRRRRDGR